MFELIYPVDPAPVLPLPTAEKPGSHARPGSEMVPIVEENGLVIGQAARQDVHGGIRLLHPVIHLHIINRDGELFIQRRSMRKRTFPGKWDTAVGGHIDYGELLETALFREAAEELGFRGFNPVYLKTYVWESPRERELINVFATVGNFKLDPHNEEVLEGRYWSMDEIESFLGKGVFTPNFEQEFASIKDTLLALL
jgi:isopentenyldiphosphate isomerase